MSSAVVVLVMTAVLTGVVAAIGAGPLALLTVPVGIAAAVWLGISGASRRSPTDAAREASAGQELLGPGGPDDPARSGH